jgi:hypothetical protein
MEATMKHRTATIAAAALTFLGVALASGPVMADHRPDTIRVNIPVHEHGPETLRLGRMIRHQRHLNLSDYRLAAVIIRNGPFSNGYASLRVGERRSGRYFLPGRERILIPSPGRGGRDWRLRLGPGTQVRNITAVLEPRRAYGYRWPGRYPYAGSPRQGHPHWHDLNRDRYFAFPRIDDRHHGRLSQRERNERLQQRNARLKDAATERVASPKRERRDGQRRNPERKAVGTSDGQHSPHRRT